MKTDREQVDLSISRLYGAGCMLHGLSGGMFENDINGLLEKKTVSFPGIPQEYINAFDWINANYETLQYMIDELCYMMQEQTIIIENYINGTAKK